MNHNILVFVCIILHSLTILLSHYKISKTFTDNKSKRRKGDSARLRLTTTTTTVHHFKLFFIQCRLYFFTFCHFFPYITTSQGQNSQTQMKQRMYDPPTRVKYLGLSTVWSQTWGSVSDERWNLKKSSHFSHIYTAVLSSVLLPLSQQLAVLAVVLSLLCQRSDFPGFCIHFIFFILIKPPISLLPVFWVLWVLGPTSKHFFLPTGSCQGISSLVWLC